MPSAASNPFTAASPTDPGKKDERDNPMKTMFRHLFALTLAGGAATAVGCAQELEEINRVQNNVTKKADLRGEWYYRQTVVDAPYTSLEFFPGNQSMLSRGVFEIQSGTLYFFRTYELMIGGETLGAASDIDTPLYEVDANGEVVIDAKTGKPKPVTYLRRVGDELVTVQKYVYRGVPLAAFPIEKHFDIQQGYNPFTGEATNVTDENSSDRQWWETEYMRVNWGASSFKPVDSVSNGSGGTSVEEYFDEEREPAEAPVYERSATGDLTYFDYLSRKTMGAPTSYLEDYGVIPSCLYYPWYLGQVAECVSERVTFREAFKRVEPSDYVAWDYDDKNLKKFGFFRNERSQYDAVYGNTFSGASRRIQRHRMWETYVVKQGAACDLAADSDAQNSCQAGEVCEALADGKAFCVNADANDRLDYSKMTPKPVVYYMSEQYPRELVPEAVQLAANWSTPLVDVVAVRKGTAPEHPMFIVCENNRAEAAAAMQALGKDVNNAADVEEAQKAGLLGEIDPTFCADMDKTKRFGDLRYSLLASVNAPISYGLYGYGPSSADALSGENLSANAYMYTPAMKQGANMAMVAIELQTGIRSFWESVYANHVRDVGEKGRLGAAQGGLPKYTLATARLAAKGLLTPDVRERLETMGVEKTDGAYAENRMALLAKNAPELAAELVTEDVKVMLRDPSLAFPEKDTTDKLVARAGMQVWGHHRGNLGKKLEEMRVNSTRACRFEDHFADNAILGLAREYGQAMDQAVCDAAKASGNPHFDFQVFEEYQGPCDSEGAESADGLLKCVNVATGASQEGLFWENRCSVGQLKAQIANAVVDLEQTNPYYFANDYFPPDPIYTNTKHESLNAAQMVIRDAIEAKRGELVTALYKRIYQGVAEHEVGHTLGLRHNFEASTDAINFGKEYWDLKGKFGQDGKFHATDMFAGETAYQTKNMMRQMQSASVMDYSAKFNDRFQGVGYYDRAAIRYGYGGLVEVFNKTPDTEQFAKYMEDPADTDPSNTALVPDLSTTPLESVFKRLHYTRIPDLYKADAENAINNLYDRKFVPVTTLDDTVVEVPYRFCSDELSYRIPTCATRDSGADSFEIVRNALEDYEQYWPIWGYWHESLLFQPSIYYNRVAFTFGAIKMQLQWWALEVQRFNRNGWWQDRFGTTWDQDENAGLNGAVAVQDSLNVLAAAFGRPEPGTHGYNVKKNVYEPLPYLDSSLYSNYKLITPINCDARDLYPAYDYDGYLPIATRAGAIYDRLVAFEVLADPTGMFIANDQQNDVTKYLLSYYTLFPKELMNLYSGMVANKTDLWGWYMVTNDKGTPDHCVRRNIRGPEAKSIDEMTAELVPGQKVWALNPEPEYTFPTTRFRVPMLAALYGLSMFNDAYDQSFTDVTRVFVDGHKDGITPSDDADVVSFTDPLSGKTYSATVSKFSSGLFHPGKYMIERLEAELAEYNDLSELQENYNYSEYQFVIDKLELLRGMNAAYDGTAVYF